ncbi:MAG: hypothetical protein ACQEV7_19985 [Bacillota bacterium]
MEKVVQTYSSKFKNKGLLLETAYDKEGDSPFLPGYRSALSIGISDNEGELIDLHTIVIWECERTFLGIPITKNIFGSKVTGMLLEESPSEITNECTEYLEEQLEMLD